jgi:hypothetical protein
MKRKFVQYTIYKNVCDVDPAAADLKDHLRCLKQHTETAS